MKKIIFTNLLNPISWEKAEYQKEIYITIEDNIITSIEKEPQCFLTTIDDMSDCVCYPGFIDLHTHIYQYDIRGSYKNNLLEWLNNYTFPEEIKVSNTDYAKCIADKMIQNLIYCGTSTACLYSTIHRNAFEIAVNKALKFGLRTIIGKVMMDMNSPAQLTEKTQQSINESIELYKTFDNITNLIEYCFTPRFALSCSFDLMQKLGQYIQNISPYVQTHLSENIDEVKSVKTYFQNAVSYTDVYNQAGILGPKTLLAHAIHLDNTELNLIKKSRSSIVHCPDSNFFLKSGTFNLNKILEYQIPFGLGSDIGAGTNLYMPYHARMMIYRQDNFQINPLNAFYSFTLGSAEALKKSNQIGSIQPLKFADMTFVKQDITYTNPEEIVSKLIFTTNPTDVKKVIVNGKTIHEKD